MCVFLFFYMNKNYLTIDIPQYQNISGIYVYKEEHQLHPVYAREDDYRHVIYWTTNHVYNWANQWCIQN